MPLDNQRAVSCSDCKSTNTPKIFTDDGGAYIECADCHNLIIELDDDKAFERALNFRPPFGKHIGLTMREIFEKEPGYLHMLARKFDDKRIIRKALLTIWYLENAV